VVGQGLWCFPARASQADCVSLTLATLSPGPAVPSVSDPGGEGQPGHALLQVLGFGPGDAQRIQYGAGNDKRPVPQRHPLGRQRHCQGSFISLYPPTREVPVPLEPLEQRRNGCGSEQQGLAKVLYRARTLLPQGKHYKVLGMREVQLLQQRRGVVDYGAGSDGQRETQLAFEQKIIFAPSRGSHDCNGKGGTPPATQAPTRIISYANSSFTNSCYFSDRFHPGRPTPPSAGPSGWNPRLACLPSYRPLHV
jgi:hypothetical protein